MKNTSPEQVLRLVWSACRVSLRSAILPLSVLLRRHDRHLMWRLEETCFGSRRPGVYPEITLTDLVSGEDVVTLEALAAQSYNVTESELLVIASLTRAVNATIAFEIGTADGRTALNIANNMDGTVFTLNLPLDQDPGHSQDVPVGHRFLRKAVGLRIKQLWGDSKTFDFSPYAGRCQIVFIDGDHYDPGVNADIETAARLVDRRGGVILWHDALRFDVQTALPRFAEQFGLPVHLISNTNLAALFFRSGDAVTPMAWAKTGKVNKAAL